MIKKLIKVLFIIVIIVCIALVPIFNQGVDLYHENYSEEKLYEIINEIQSNENYVQLEDISQDYLNALIESEDESFYKHNGFDIIAIGRALINNVFSMSFQQGGSTITQQLAKNLFFTFEKTLVRKVAELFVAVDIERHLSKDEIIELYCNIVYFGNGIYGVESAANFYYDKNNKELTKLEIDALLKTLKNPNNYNPFAIEN